LASGKILLSEVIAASLQLSEIAAHEIIEVKQAGELLVMSVNRVF
jgi:hypothetical protein